MSNEKRCILVETWWQGQVMTLEQALPYLKDSRFKVALPLWWQLRGEPLPAGLDWIQFVGVRDDGIEVNRIIEPLVRERFETHPPEEWVVVFKLSEAKGE